jgi:hypothetical protein
MNSALVVTLVDILVLIFVMYSNWKRAQRAYQFGYNIGHEVGYAKGQLDLGLKLALDSGMSDKEFLRKIGVKDEVIFESRKSKTSSEES